MLVRQKEEIQNNRGDEYLNLVCSECDYYFGNEIYNIHLKRIIHHPKVLTDEWTYCPVCGAKL